MSVIFRHYLKTVLTDMFNVGLLQHFRDSMKQRDEEWTGLCHSQKTLEHETQTV